MTEHETITAPVPPDDKPQRVSTLVGDRACIKCHYNLTGQAILREQHYGLLIVRCPECGEVAPMQEYPLLGRWANRLAMVAAAAYLLTLLWLFLASSSLMLGMTGGFTNGPVESFEDWMRADIAQWHREEHPEAGPQAHWSLQMSSGAEWVADRGGERGLLAHAGGLLGAFHLRWLFVYIPPCVIAFLTGVLISAMCAHRSRLQLAVISVAWLLLFGLVVYLVDRAFRVAPSVRYWEVGWRTLGVTLYGVMMVVEWLLIIAGMMVGRPIARAAIRALLPPRLRAPFSFLWIADGLAVQRS